MFGFDTIQNGIKMASNFGAGPPRHRRSKRGWIWPMRPTRRWFLWQCRCLAIAFGIFQHAGQNLEVDWMLRARNCMELPKTMGKYHEKPRLQRITLRTNPTTAIRATPRMWTSPTSAGTSRRSPTSPISLRTSPPTRPKRKRPAPAFALVSSCYIMLHSVIVCYSVLHCVTLLRDS